MGDWGPINYKFLIKLCILNSRIPNFNEPFRNSLQYLSNSIRPTGLFPPEQFPSTRSYKKDDEPLLKILTGYEPLLKSEGTYVYIKEGARVPSLNTSVYSIKKTGGRRKNVHN
jgi:hypothetical protein